MAWQRGGSQLLLGLTPLSLLCYTQFLQKPSERAKGGLETVHWGWRRDGKTVVRTRRLAVFKGTTSRSGVGKPVERMPCWIVAR
ncbi:hypothetical protein BT69DRAFT_1287015 [Atractiella rhizophila]|nr:hypothetical protein BT69DRAFT_1287015 [Atractiella rhizophila]